MGLDRPNIYGSDGRLRQLDCDWLFYVAFAPGPNNSAYLKIGISTNVYQRILGLKTGCPFPIEAVLWARCGDRRSAALVERSLHQRFSARRTAGEWFLFQMDSAEEKAEFHFQCKLVYAREIGGLLKWERVTAAQIAAYASLIATEKKVGRRPMRGKRVNRNAY